MPHPGHEASSDSVPLEAFHSTLSTSHHGHRNRNRQVRRPEPVDHYEPASLSAITKNMLSDLRGIVHHGLAIVVLSVTFYAIPILFAAKLAAKGLNAAADLAVRKMYDFIEEVSNDNGGTRYEIQPALQRSLGTMLGHALGTSSKILERCHGSNLRKKCQPDPISERAQVEDAVEMSSLAKRFSPNDSNQVHGSLFSGTTLACVTATAEPDESDTPVPTTKPTATFTFITMIDDDFEQTSPALPQDALQGLNESLVAARAELAMTRAYLSPEEEDLVTPAATGHALWQHESGDCAHNAHHLRLVDPPLQDELLWTRPLEFNDPVQHTLSGKSSICSSSSICHTPSDSYQRTRSKPLNYWFNGSTPTMQQREDAVVNRGDLGRPPTYHTESHPDGCNTCDRRRSSAAQNLLRIGSRRTSMIPTMGSRSQGQKTKKHGGGRRCHSLENVAKLGMRSEDSLVSNASGRNRLRKRMRESAD